MIATQTLPPSYASWNRTWRAPFGRRLLRGRPRGRLDARFVRAFESRTRVGSRRCGPFAWQPNSALRQFEYPWAHEQIRTLGESLTVVEIGGGLSGLQWVLAADGHRVINVDPGMAARGKGWALSATQHEHLSRAFRAPVELRPATLAEAGLADASADVLLSVSTIEHFAQEDLDEFARHAARILRPGGAAVLTIDLFLDLAPFTSVESNTYGSNVNVHELLERSGLRLRHGDPSCLLGFPEFDPERIQSRLSEYLIGTYPALAQCLVAERAPE
jgi:SAM-dependent methyltransferase